MPKIVAVFPGDKVVSPPELSDFSIRQIHAGLVIPNAESILSMSREILKWRGNQNPDAL